MAFHRLELTHERAERQPIFRSRKMSCSAPSISCITEEMSVSSFNRSTKNIHASNKSESLEPWEIASSEIEFGQKIGRGSFGTVFKGNWYGSVTINKLNVEVSSSVTLEAFKRDVNTLIKTRHSNILLFLGWIRNPDFAIVTQWCNGSSLYEHLHVFEPQTKFTIHQIIDISKQTSRGMEYLHSKDIIHSNLQSNNILLTDDNIVKISDFGLTSIRTLYQCQQKPTGSILWMAPEVIRMDDQDALNFYSDVYSYGIILFELASGLLPYSNLDNKDSILLMVGRGYLKIDVDECRSDIPKTFRKLILDCVQFQKHTRPNFKMVSDILSDIFIRLPKFLRSVSAPQLFLVHDKLPVTPIL